MLTLTFEPAILVKFLARAVFEENGPGTPEYNNNYHSSRQ